MAVSFRRFRTGSDVQRRVRAGKPSSGGGVQAVADRRVRYIPECQQETEADAAQNGHRHGTIIIISRRAQYAQWCPPGAIFRNLACFFHIRTVEGLNNVGYNTKFTAPPPPKSPK